MRTTEGATLLRAATPLSGRVPGLAMALVRLAEDLEVARADELAVRLCLHPGIALDLARVPLHLRTLGRGDPLLAVGIAADFGMPGVPAGRQARVLPRRAMTCVQLSTAGTGG